MPSPPAFYWLRGDFPIMSRSAAAPQQKPGPRIRRARFAEEDLVSTFGETMLAEARRLLGAGAVDLTTTGRAIEATIVADREHRRVVLNPTQTGPRVAFLGTCEPMPFPQAQRAHEPALGEAACVHRAAAALAALARISHSGLISVWRSGRGRAST